MYIFYTGPKKQYAYIGTTSRTGSKTKVGAIYIGRVLDKEAGIYQNKQRGVFTFNINTGEYGDPPESYVPKVVDGRRKSDSIVVDFGDAYFLDTILKESAYMEVIDSVEYGNRDTLHAMLLFYILSSLANCDAIAWYKGSVARILYPDADLTSQRISSFLARIGTPENIMRFQCAHIPYVKVHFFHDMNVLLDSSGLPNSIHCPLTCRNIHNGKVSNEIRLIFVVQKSTGIPLYFDYVAGNIVDITTLSRVFLHLESMEVDVSSCIMDAGYNSGANLDIFYDEKHEVKINFITRVSSGDTTFKKLCTKNLDELQQKKNLVQFEDRYLYLIKEPVMVGTNENNPAWMYIGLDCNRLSDELHKLLKRAKKEKLSIDEVYDLMQTQGLFAILASKDYSCDEILPAYYERQAIEQSFDIIKNYTKLLPLRTHTAETFSGHLLLACMAADVIKMIQLRLKTADLFFSSKLAWLRNQKCTIYPHRIVTKTPQKEANDAYKAFGIECPEEIGIENGRLVNSCREPGSISLCPPSLKKKKVKKGESASDKGEAQIAEKVNETPSSDAATGDKKASGKTRKRTKDSGKKTESKAGQESKGNTA